MNRKPVKSRRLEGTATSLRMSIADETDDIKEYRDGARKVDTKTAKLYRHIAREEAQHKKELSRRLKEI